MYSNLSTANVGCYHGGMAFPEKTKRNEDIFFLHVNGTSYRDIMRSVKLGSVKSVYRIVARMRKRHKNVIAFVRAYKRSRGK